MVADSGDAPAAAAAAPVPAPAPATTRECYRCQDTSHLPTRLLAWEEGERREPWYLCELPGFCYKAVTDALAKGWDPSVCAGWDGLAFPQMAKWLVLECDGARYAAWLDPIRALSIAEVKGLGKQDPAWVRRAALDYVLACKTLELRGGAPPSVDSTVPWRAPPKH